MAIGRISGPMLFSNLDRQGTDLAFESNLLYLDVNNGRVGVVNSSPQYSFDASGNVKVSNIVIEGNVVSSNTGRINFGGISNVVITGGGTEFILYTDGAGNLAFGNISSFAVINEINSNISAANLSISSLQSNIAAANVRIQTIDANIGVISSNIDMLVANASSQQANIDAINANVASANVHIAALEANITNIVGNTIIMGANSSGYLVSNAVALTTATTVTDGIAQLNFVLGKLVPPSPPSFPGASTLSVSTSTSTGRMANFAQTDNSGWGNLSVAAGTSVSATRVSTYVAGTITTVGPGDAGTVTAYLNGTAAGNVTMATGSQNGTYGNLVIASDQDYSAIIGGSGGFWQSFNASLSGSSIPAGWNRANVRHSLAGTTNTITWYYDNSTPGTPTFSNTSIALTSNSSTYSSTIPHFNSSTSFRIKANVARLSGDTYPVGVTSGSSTLVTASAGGAFAAPSTITYTSAGVTVPLDRNLYVSSGSAYIETTVATTTGFGSSASGPSLTVNNNYASGASGALIVSGTPTVLYKTGTASTMEETTVTFGSTVGTGSGTASRIINPGSTDNPAYTAGASLFNSQTSTLETYDATIVAAVLKHDQTNYSSGYLPVGPDLSSGRTTAQYFTFRFVRTSVSKFNVKFTGTIAGLWVALPGSGIDTSSTLNGWVDMSLAYAGAGQPGAGTGGNGSNGCALGGVVTLNSAVTAHSKTCTFGTASSSSTATNEIYVRVKLTSGQTVTALSLETASN